MPQIGLERQRPSVAEGSTGAASWRRMAHIGILTGGGDVPGLNSVIKSVTYRSSELGWRVSGIRRGWQGLTHLVPGHE